jgi:hypothetical protein
LYRVHLFHYGNDLFLDKLIICLIQYKFFLDNNTALRGCFEDIFFLEFWATPNCLCPSKDKFPPPYSNGASSKATWRGYELGPKCEIQRGCKCYIDMANKEAKFQPHNCLGATLYCVPYKNNPRFKICGSKEKCETIPSCRKSLNATDIALEIHRKTWTKQPWWFKLLRWAFS